MKSSVRNICLLVIGALLLPFLLQAQSYYVDNKGVLRSKSDKKEVAFFGVNYTLPFAHAFRMHKKLGIDMKKAIDRDVYHFARLGYNAYRIHVWDTEISDEEGNLLNNEHLDLMDYLTAKLKERNIKILYTPIAFWGNGYPEQNESLPGFSGKWSKCDMTRVEEAILAQEKYLYQFAEHLNPYTGQKIKDDPDVVGFEINNEPCNATEPDTTEMFVNRMVNAIRKTNCKKPIFYNVSHNFQNTQAFYDAKIDGGTFQWYPSGLVANRTRPGNFLPSVDSYPIPFDTIKHYKEKAKIVYEFDPADIADPYIYPVMARSFRSAGFQWITQFAYDPMEIAWANTEYQTHYLNLAYTPGKAISTKIAAEIVNRVPRNASFGNYPADTIFDVFRVSYREKLSVMNDPQKFFYSNNTSDKPVNPVSLKEIAGWGSSPVVSYEGTGAYFLDKLSDGIWRLEVMPDAVWTKDPFEKASIQKEVATILWHQWPMQINIPDLGNDFIFKGINEGNKRNGNALQHMMEVTPGVYLLSRKGVETNKWNAASKLGQIQIGEYVAPDSHVNTFDVIHQPTIAVTAGKEHTIRATIIGASSPDSVQILTNNQWIGSRGVHPLVMEKTKGYIYETTLSADKVTVSELQYRIIVFHNGKSYTFPAAKEGNPADWDFYDDTAWSVQVEPQEQFITLYDSNLEFDKIEPFIVKGRRYMKSLRVGDYPSQKYTRVTTDKLEPEQELLVRHYIKEKVDGRKDKLNESNYLCLKVGNINGIDLLHIGFITVDGLTFKKEVKTTNETIRIPLKELELTQTILQPQAYPSFLPDYFTPRQTNISFNQMDVEFLEISSGTNNRSENPVIEIECAWME